MVLFAVYFFIYEYIIAKSIFARESISPREKFALAIAAVEARRQWSCAFIVWKIIFAKNYIPSQTINLEWRQKRHFQTCKISKRLISYAPFCWRRGSKARKGRELGERRRWHTIGKENCWIKAARNQRRKLGRSKDYVLHKMRLGLKQTSSRSESLNILMKMENTTSGLECSELMMNMWKAKRTKY